MVTRDSPPFPARTSLPSAAIPPPVEHLSARVSPDLIGDPFWDALLMSLEYFSEDLLALETMCKEAESNLTLDDDPENPQSHFTSEFILQHARRLRTKLGSLSMKEGVH